jgi:hypothetical protein
VRETDIGLRRSATPTQSEATILPVPETAIAQTTLLQMALDEGISSSPADEQGTAEPAAQSAGAAEINVDELTRRVYQEIKRRLSTEWERMRRRL